jgi:hypothetical protein
MTHGRPAMPTDVRVGSSTDLMAPKFDFRFSCESGLNSDIAACQKRATSRLTHCSREQNYLITLSAMASAASR